MQRVDGRDSLDASSKDHGILTVVRQQHQCDPGQDRTGQDRSGRRV